MTSFVYIRGQTLRPLSLSYSSFAFLLNPTPSYDHNRIGARWYFILTMSWSARTYVLYVLSSLSVVRVYLPELILYKYPARY